MAFPNKTDHAVPAGNRPESNTDSLQHGSVRVGRCGWGREPVQVTAKWNCTWKDWPRKQRKQRIFQCRIGLSLMQIGFIDAGRDRHRHHHRTPAQLPWLASAFNGTAPATSASRNLTLACKSGYRAILSRHCVIAPQ